jgi:hypothetical protein
MRRQYYKNLMVLLFPSAIFFLSFEIEDEVAYGRAGIDS